MNLTVGEIVELLDVRERTVTRWIESEGLPASYVHGAWQVHRAELFDWASTRGLQLPKRFFVERGGLDEARDFASALRNGGVHMGLFADGPRALAKAIATAVTGSNGTGTVAAVLAARPSLGFVAVRDRIAVPRLVAPIIGPGLPAVALCVFDEVPPGVGVVARAFFAVRAPTVHLHHLLVEDLYAAIDDERFRKAALAGEALHALVGDLARPPGRASGRASP